MFIKKIFPRQVILSLLQRFKPTDEQLRRLSRKDRPGLTITLPEVETSSLEKGRQAFYNGDYAEALFFFGQTTKEDPNNAWGWHGRGDALQLLRDYKGALQAYEHALSLQPNNALHLGGKANALLGLQRHHESEVAKQRALELDGSIKWLFTN